MKKGILKITIFLSLFIFYPFFAKADDVNRITTTYYHTTVTLKGRVYLDGTNSSIPYNTQANEVDKNYDDPAVMAKISDLKAEFNAFATENKADTREVVKEGIVDYYYNAHDEVTYLPAASCVEAGYEVIDIPDTGGQGCVVVNTVLNKYQVYEIVMKANVFDYRISEVNLTVTIPKVGDEITVDGDDWKTQKPQATITLPDNVNYSLDAIPNYMSYGIRFNFFMNGLEDSGAKPFSGAFARNQKYDMQIALRAVGKYYFTKDTVVKINGETVANGYVVNGEIEDNTGVHEGAVYYYVNYQFTPIETIYTILNGADQTYLLGTKDALVIRADGDLDMLTGIMVNNELIDKENYELKSGSTILTLKDDYLNSLKAGEYELTFVYKDGVAETKFTIGEEDTKNTENPDVPDVPAVITPPPTSDNILVSISIAGISAIVIAGLFISKKKRHN